ncbi:hypothetical protein HIM_11953 [Hirsutella minnesotensis 3608]|uniref:Uncharacterized protein n=1 Tax=Hirsutella minnesotensis 3608 TaxID=1043627 RepID=A0A0F7ZQY2_9HYPO|nr:hypothetical protein HIM_11953 [Hirsutella minnesotensis 3608]
MAESRNSKDPLTVADVVAFLKRYQQDEPFESLAKKEDALNFLQLIFAPLQRCFAVSSGKPLSKPGPGTSNSSRANRKRIEDITKDQLQIPKIIASNIEAYKEDAALFWDQPIKTSSAYCSQEKRQDRLRTFIDGALRLRGELEKHTILHRFVCVSIYASFTAVFPTAIRITSHKVRLILEYAGVKATDENIEAFTKLVQGGRNRERFCKQLQADACVEENTSPETVNNKTTEGFALAKFRFTEVDYGPLFLLGIPDQIWDGSQGLEKQDVQSSIQYLQSLLKAWSERVKATSLAKKLLDFHFDLFWDIDGPPLFHEGPLENRDDPCVNKCVLSLDLVSPSIEQAIHPLSPSKRSIEDNAALCSKRPRKLGNKRAQHPHHDSFAAIERGRDGSPVPAQGRSSPIVFPELDSSEIPSLRYVDSAQQRLVQTISPAAHLVPSVQTPSINKDLAFSEQPYTSCFSTFEPRAMRNDGAMLQGDLSVDIDNNLILDPSQFVGFPDPAGDPSQLAGFPDFVLDPSQFAGLGADFTLNTAQTTEFPNLF